MAYILSTMSASVDYHFYRKAPNGAHIVDKTITINGGANVANKHLVTKEGVITEVTKEQIDELKGNPVFQIHLKNGFVKINMTSSDNVSSMEKADSSAPLTPSKYENKKIKAKTTGD